MSNVWTTLRNITSVAYKKKHSQFRKFKRFRTKKCENARISKDELHKRWHDRRLRNSIQFGSFKNSLYYRSAIEKLIELKKYAEKTYKRNESYNEIRQAHNDNKSNYFAKWKHCFVCKKADVENIHHIIQIQHGGTNDEGNIIGLCRSCHSDIHPWMKA